MNIKRITIQNTVITYLDNEKMGAKTLFFVHGWGADKYNLQGIFASLKDSYRVISVDLPGFGESSVPEKVIGSNEYADILISFIHALHLDAICYIGHSFGGKIGIVITAKEPGLIKRLVLINSSGLRAKHTIGWYIKVGVYKTMKFFYLSILRSPEKLETFKAKSGSDDYRNAGAMRNILVRVVGEDYSHILPEITCPVFLYWGDKDDATPIWMAKKMERLIPDAALHVVKNGGHYSFVDDNRIISIIDAFAAEM